MKFTTEFRDEKLANILVKKIRKLAQKPVRIMEVCGGHTMAIRRFGIQTLLPPEIELLSGPGCPVCVTDQRFIDEAIALCRIPDTILLTYGDMLRVPGSYSSLEKEKASGADVRIINSTLDALDLARRNPEKKIIFAAIGFETTTPGTALAILQAEKEDLQNFSIICAHKTMPEAMAALIDEGIPIDGYIGPGHVSAVSGEQLFHPLTEKYRIPVVISGFEAVDLLQSICMILEMVNQKKSGVANQYRRLVNEKGNLKAQMIVEKVFEPSDEYWRGLGIIKSSGLKLKDKYQHYNAIRIFNPDVRTGEAPKGCICGKVLKGIKKPTDCGLYKKTCTPENPVGACMVSAEGTCHSYFQYSS